MAAEDLRRARARVAVARLRGAPRRLATRLRLFALLIGPGILVFLGENDAPSMLSYAATGAGYGIGFFLPFVAATFALGFIVQEMAARVGAVTSHGHAELIFDRFGSFWGRFAMADLMVGNFLTLITEFIGVRAGLGFFGVPPAAAVGAGVALVLFAAATARYTAWERITLGLALCNAVFVPVALLSHPDWGAIGHAMATWSPLPGGLKPDTVTLMVSNIGATVTPWMLFFQQGAVADKGLDARDIGAARWDTAIGSIIAALFGMAAIIATAPLFEHGISPQNWQAAQFAEAIEPYVGHTGAALFALGIFEAGVVAAITISTSSAYAFAEVMRAPHSLNAPLREGWIFYAVLAGSAGLAGAIVLAPGMPLEQVVIIVNVIAVLAMPPALLFLLLIANDAEVMGPYRNAAGWNIAGVGVTVFLILVGLGYAANVLFPSLLGGG
ncbi:MAG TPA: divalent metal cation transporter [Acetobacteraceae bacterium]|nr:divalent metal cation transporter [Acetobacteraceae bacterium]